MAKSGRKKKEKRKDFQKVKFKVGKKKPKADNFTDTTFRSQAIQIREQLKSGQADTAEPTTQKKKNIHDLLCHLNHYNAAVRQSSIAGMKELLSSHPSLISQHLSLLIDSLSVLMMDKEDMVRKAGISLLQLVLQATPADNVGPFFPILAAHLTCAMTHIQEDIQLDSLAVLDLMLASYPRLLTVRSQELLTVFVQLISRQRKRTVGWTEGEADGGDLAVKPGSRISSHKWRQKVLQRLRQFLKALLEEHYTKYSGQVKGTAGNEDYTVKVNNQKETYTPIFAPGAQCHWYKEEFVFSSLTSSSSSQTSSQALSEPSNLLGFVRSLVPLLLQCWMEVAPKSQVQSQPHLHVVAMEILDGVMSVILLLWRWMQGVCEERRDFSCMKQLQKLYHKKFVTHLLPCFPYVSHNPPARAKHSGKGTPSAVSAVSLNLAACEIMSYFMIGSNTATPWLRQIMAYVLEICVEGGDLSLGHMPSLLDVVRRLVKVLPSAESVSDLLQAVFSLHQSCHNLSGHKQATLQCLDELLTGHGKTHPSSRSIDSLFLQTLPELVRTSGPVSSKAVQILLRRASQRQDEALACVRQYLKSFVDPESGILLKLPADLQVHIIHLIHHADPLDLDTLKLLAFCCHDDRMSAENVTYLVNVMSTRFLDAGIAPCADRQLPFDTADFISFLFSVSVGCLHTKPMSKDGQDVPKGMEGNSLLPSNLTSISIATKTGRSMQHHSTIVKSVCLSYSLISSKEQMWDAIQMLIISSLNSRRATTCGAAYGMLHTVNFLTTPMTYWSQEIVNKLTECCLAILYSVVSDDLMGFGRSDWSEAVWEEVVDLLVVAHPVLVEMLQRIYARVGVLTDHDHVQNLAMVVVRLLQTQRLSSILAQLTDHVMQAVHSIMNHHLATEGSRWAAELQYEASMTLKAPSQR
ncbi:testis-expressed protein 10 homolog [Acanthaster planci]|uniref:Testis-expressed protein 10 homolog n=1 Tax=Acanthaster planci TaxID=133434 RepID=A0A8B7XJK1_ACAPL|nr:testis-expressed protein 10 homolog [Acanthaster planci]XP_022080130.1 testis-expressed protein 10 homolog [Acanthaster planci]